MDTILSHTTDEQVKDKIFTLFNELSTELERVKMQVKLKENDLTQLQSLQVNESDNKDIKSMFSQDDSDQSTEVITKADRFRLDSLQLKQRSLSCEDIKNDVLKCVQELTKDLKFQEERMADVKGMPRAMVKLQE